MATPQKLAHVVLYTSQVDAMRAWYCKVLGAEVVWQGTEAAGGRMCFVTYDDEHHRVAFIDAGRTDGPVDAHNGLAHIAFTYGSLDELLETYAGLERDAIVPALSVNHGPTTSLYYRDPDGNQVELQVDNFATVAEGHAYMQSPAFAHNPVGVFFDPAELWRRVSTGEPVEDLLWHD